MGAKTGYADAILAVMGLRPGQRAGHYLWCEPDPGCRLLLEAYRDRELAQAAADIIRGWKDEEPRALWERLRAEGPVKDDGGAREVGRWLWVAGRGYHGSAWGSTFLPIEHPVNGTNGTSPACTANRLGSGPAMPATITPDARTVEPVPSLPPGTVAYIDPPYVGTTGYASDLPRSEVVRLAQLWSEAGARVYISEAEPLAELDGWHRVEITATRKGQKRTFSKQQAEWLTCSHRPAWTPAVQSGLFGGGS